MFGCRSLLESPLNNFLDVAMTRKLKLTELALLENPVFAVRI